MLQKKKVVFKNIVVKEGEEYHLVNFIMGDYDSPEHRYLSLPDDNLTKKELDFMEENSPIIEFTGSFYEMLDSKDSVTQEMAKGVLISKIKFHVDKWI